MLSLLLILLTAQVPAVPGETTLVSFCKQGREVACQELLKVNPKLAAAIMAQVVRVTPATAEQERPVLVEALATDWGRSPAEAEQLADAALELLTRSVDFQRIARELARRSTEAQRAALLDTLFTVANAADNVSPREIDEIRVITDRLNLAQHQFIAAKRKIPAAERGGL